MMSKVDAPPLLTQRRRRRATVAVGMSWGSARVLRAMAALVAGRRGRGAAGRRQRGGGRRGRAGRRGGWAAGGDHERSVVDRLHRPERSGGAQRVRRARIGPLGDARVPDRGGLVARHQGALVPIVRAMRSSPCWRPTTRPSAVGGPDRAGRLRRDPAQRRRPGIGAAGRGDRDRLRGARRRALPRLRGAQHRRRSAWLDDPKPRRRRSVPAERAADRLNFHPACRAERPR